MNIRYGIPTLIISLMLTSACGLLSESDPQVPPLAPTETPVVNSPTPLITSEPEITQTNTTAPPSATAPASPTFPPTETSIPDGFGLVPDLRGLPLSEARVAALNAGFSYLFQDVLDPEILSGTIIDQDPPPGTAIPFNEVIFLYRSFQALEMLPGGACQPLQITLPAGKLLYWVELEEGVRYNVRTDFPYGKTQVSDYRMFLIAEFDNNIKDSVEIKLLAPGRYVISLGPYEVSKDRLEREGRIPAGCLWITPEDLEQAN